MSKASKKNELIKLLVEDISEDNMSPKTLHKQSDIAEKLNVSRQTVHTYLLEIYNENNLSKPIGGSLYTDFPYTEFIRNKVKEKNKNPETSLEKIKSKASEGAAFGVESAFDKHFGPRDELLKQVEKKKDEVNHLKVTLGRILKILIATLIIIIIWYVIYFIPSFF